MNISFLYPQFLWAFSLLAIPIVIHLFNFRKYKEIYFPNTLFLKHIKEQSKSANQLKNLLLLLLRLLIFSCLILAFAMPYSNRNNNPKQSTNNLHAFYLNNSFSMNAQNENGSLLIQAKKQIEALVQSLPNNDYFLLTTNDFEGKHSRHFDKNDFLTELERIEESPSSKTLAEIYTRQQSDIAQAPSTTLYWLSDFQKNEVNKKIIIDTNQTLFVLPLSASTNNNISIDSVWFESPIRKTGSAEELKINITNHGTKEANNISVKLSLNGEQKAFNSFTIQGNSSLTVSLAYTIFKTGKYDGLIEIEDYPIGFDNRFYFSYEIRKQSKVLQINDKQTNDSYFKLFKNDSSVSFQQQNIRQLDYSILKEQHLIILNELESYSSGLIQELQKYCSSGGSLFIVPLAKNTTHNTLNKALGLDEFIGVDTAQTRVNDINYSSDFFQNVFTSQELQSNEKQNLPAVYSHQKINTQFLQGKEILLSLLNNDPYLLRYKKESANIYLICSSLSKNSSTFLQNSICVPVLYRMVLVSLASNNLYHIITSSLKIPLPTGKKLGNYTISNNHQEFTINTTPIGEQEMLYVGNQLKKDGFYKLKNKQNETTNIALNYNRKESQLTFCSDVELKEVLGNQKNIQVISTDEIKSSSSTLDALNKKEYWKYFIVAALVALAIEVIVYALPKRKTVL